MDTTDTTRDDSGAIGFVRWLVETAALVALAFVLAMTFRATVVEAYQIPTGSMEPTIMTFDRILAEKVSLHFHDPRIGDVVVVTDPTGGPIPFVKRVIAVSGQTVDVHDQAVWIDGVMLDEPYTHELPSEPLSLQLPVTVPEGSVWLMGDNRTNSSDSRDFGPVAIDSIQARGLCVYWPIGHAGGLDGTD